MECIYIPAKLWTTYRRKPPSPSGSHFNVVPKLGCDRPSVYFGDQSHPSLRALILTALLLPWRSPPVVPSRSVLSCVAGWRLIFSSHLFPLFSLLGGHIRLFWCRQRSLMPTSRHIACHLVDTVECELRVAQGHPRPYEWQTGTDWICSLLAALKIEPLNHKVVCPAGQGIPGCNFLTSPIL